MANQLSNTVGLLIDNPAPLPDGTAEAYSGYGSTSAAGTTQANAAPLVFQITSIPNNAATNGVILPVGTPSQEMEVMSLLVTAVTLIYPPVGGTINAGTVNAPVSLVARKPARFVAYDATGLNWMYIQGA